MLLEVSFVGFEVLMAASMKSSGLSRRIIREKFTDGLEALMIEAASTSETSVNFYQTTRRYNPEDSHL
jgi:hypothetical protein